MDSKTKQQNNQLYQIENYSKGCIDYNGKLRNVALFGQSNLVLLVDEALLIYKI